MTTEFTAQDTHNEISNFSGTLDLLDVQEVYVQRKEYVPIKHKSDQQKAISRLRARKSYDNFMYKLKQKGAEAQKIYKQKKKEDNQASLARNSDFDRMTYMLGLSCNLSHHHRMLLPLVRKGLMTESEKRKIIKVCESGRRRVKRNYRNNVRREFLKVHLESINPCLGLIHCIAPVEAKLYHYRYDGKKSVDEILDGIFPDNVEVPPCPYASRDIQENQGQLTEEDREKIRSTIGNNELFEQLKKVGFKFKETSEIKKEQLEIRKKRSEASFKSNRTLKEKYIKEFLEKEKK